MQLRPGNVPEAESRSGRFPQAGKGNSLTYFICILSEAVSPRSHSKEFAKETQESSLHELRSSFASCSR